MKKIFIALSVLMAIALGAGPSMAVVGTLDDVKGVDLFVPFFLVDRNLTAPTENTLVVMQEMSGRGGAAGVRFHGFLYDINSNIIFDWWTDPLTAFDVDQFYMSDVLLMMPVISRVGLEVTVNSIAYYTGYVILENPTRNINHIGGWVYQVSLEAGKASCAKLPSREWAIGAAAVQEGLTGVYTAGVSYIPNAANVGSSIYQRQVINCAAATTVANTTDYEGFSANALAVTSERAFGYIQSTPLAAVATWDLFPRYFLMDSNAATYFFIWTNDVRAAYRKHVNVFDENENMLSVSVPLANELNIINARDYLPPGFISGNADFGFFNFAWTPADVLNPMDATTARMDWVVYSYQMATGAIGQSWNVLERGFCSVGT